MNLQLNYDDQKIRQTQNHWTAVLALFAFCGRWFDL